MSMLASTRPAIAVNLSTDCSAPGDKIDSVLATALVREGQHTPARHREDRGITRDRRARPS
jgi:hypothetical protein